MADCSKISFFSFCWSMGCEKESKAFERSKNAAAAIYQKGIWFFCVSRRASLLKKPCLKPNFWGREMIIKKRFVWALLCCLNTETPCAFSSRANFSFQITFTSYHCKNRVDFMHTVLQGLNRILQGRKVITTGSNKIASNISLCRKSVSWIFLVSILRAVVLADIVVGGCVCL